MPPEIFRAVEGSPFLTAIVTIATAVLVIDKAWFHVRRVKAKGGDSSEKKRDKAVEQMAKAITDLTSNMKSLKYASERAHERLASVLDVNKDALERIERKVDAA